jgi:hypothetical protein
MRLRKKCARFENHSAGAEHRWLACTCALLAATAARASSIRDEISVSGSQSTSQNPRSGSFSNLLAASIDVGEDWSVNAGAQITVEAPTPAPPGTAFGDRGGTVTNFSGGFDWEATDHWTFGFAFDVSPESTVSSNASVTLQDGGGDALVRATSSNASVELLAAYDTAGISDLEWSFTGAVSLGRFETTQRIAAAQRSDGTALTTADLRTECSPLRSRCHALVPAIDGLSDELRSARISGSALATIGGDTDLGVAADYYAYFDDPGNVGVFSIGAAGRFGAGAPIAPLRWLVRPELTRRFGALSLRLSLQAGQYEPQVGQRTAGLGLKAQYRFSRSFRVWVSASGQRDVAWSGEVSRTGFLALGAAYRF